MKYKLSDICSFRKGKVEVENLNTKNYISTENMLPNKCGIIEASSLPSVALTQEYKNGDILVSNIRPYFKKIWKAKYDGGCSNDVLVFVAKSNTDRNFLYYVLSDDYFFTYSMTTSKGTKMPRGDKTSIMQYEVPMIDLQIQKKIASILKSFDEKIELNNVINNNLEEQLSSLFTHTFAGSISLASDDTCPMIGDLVTVIDNRGKTPPLTTETLEYPIIDVGALKGAGRIVDFNNCTKYVDQATYDTWFRSGHPKPWDILLSTVGSLAEMKIYLGTKGCMAQNVVALRATSISPLYLYQYLRFIRADLVAYNIGSVQPSIKVTHIIKHPIFVPEAAALRMFEETARAITQQLYANYNENESLKELRDTLLPKLMSGELDVSNLDI
jgi:Restriction endonuclease S subunits